MAELDWEEVTCLSPENIVGNGMSYVPQVDNVFLCLTIHKNPEMGAFIRTGDCWNKLQEKYELFAILNERKTKKVGKLPGWQRQMMAVGRTQMLDPTVLLLDEPSACLAPILVGMIFENIVDIKPPGSPACSSNRVP